MLDIPDDGVNLITYPLIQDANFFHQMPGAGVIDQEFSLLTFFDQWRTKSVSLTAFQSILSSSLRLL